MPRKKKIGVCVYYGAQGKVTDDHVPPRRLFPKKFWSEVIKVPACDNCKGRISKDDEYSKLAKSTRLDLEDHPAIDEISSAVTRSLSYPEARRLLNSCLRSTVPIEVFSPGGIYLGRASGFTTNMRRLNRVATRIVKGLFYHEYGERLSNDYVAAASIESGMRFDRMPEYHANLVRTLTACAETGTPKTTGKGVFTYQSCCARPWSRN